MLVLKGVIVSGVIHWLLEFAIFSPGLEASSLDVHRNDTYNYSHSLINPIIGLSTIYTVYPILSMELLYNHLSGLNWMQGFWALLLSEWHVIVLLFFSWKISGSTPINILCTVVYTSLRVCKRSSSGSSSSSILTTNTQRQFPYEIWKFIHCQKSADLSSVLVCTGGYKSGEGNGVPLQLQERAVVRIQSTNLRGWILWDEYILNLSAF